jgi:hypothetical protein
VLPSTLNRNRMRAISSPTFRVLQLCHRGITLTKDGEQEQDEGDQQSHIHEGRQGEEERLENLFERMV